MNRHSRLSSARHWLATQKGRTPVQIAKSYRKHYGVDWPCALQELEILGVRLPESYLAQLKQSLAGNLRARAIRQAREEANENLLEADSNEQFAYIAGYTANGVPFGTTWEELEAMTKEPKATKFPQER